MSHFILDGAPAQDQYLHLADEDPLPARGAVSVSLERWTREEDVLTADGRAVGVRLPNTTDLAKVNASLFELPLLVLEFPIHADGRAYSQARLLRERYGFTGELRASGEAVVQDQVAQLRRCGFNAFVLRKDQDAEAFMTAIRKSELHTWYQPAL